MVQPDYARHRALRELVRGRSLGLSGHAELETYSVLTRLPPPQRLTPATALRLIRTNFPQTRRLPVSRAAEALDELAALGLAGGSTYDALVALVARHHDLTLLSTDARAASTYQRLRIEFILA